MKKLLFLLAFLGCINLLNAQVPQGINYQTVIRNDMLNPIAGQQVSFRVSFTDGDISPNELYAETHDVATDELGMVFFTIGQGEAVSGNFAALDWTAVREVRIELDETGGSNYALLGTLPLQSVPYALLAQDVVNKDDADADPTNELQVMFFDDATGELTLTGGNSVFVYDPANLDKDTTNELQLLSFDEGSASLSISKGNSVQLPTVVVPDADADPTNELQTLDYDSATGVLLISDGNQVVIPAGGDDADADPTNELQTLDYDINTGILTISDGNQVAIPSGGPDDDADPTNELQGLVFDPNTGDLTITDSNTVNVYDPANLDKDPTNELQLLELDTTAGTLTISGGNTIVLPTIGGGVSPWEKNLDDIYYDGGNVGIGREADSLELEVEGTIWAGGTTGATTLSEHGAWNADAAGGGRAFLGANVLSAMEYSGQAAPGKGILYVRDAVTDTCCVTGVLGVNNADGSGLLEIYGASSKKLNAYLGSALGCSDCGALELLGPNGGPALLAGASPATAGYLIAYGTNGQANAELSFLTGDPDHGALVVNNDGGQTTGIFASTAAGGVLQLASSSSQARLLQQVNQSDAGSIIGAGPASLNFVLDNSLDNADWGYVAVLNHSSQESAGMTSAGSGEGLIFTVGTNGNPNTAMTSLSTDPDAGFIAAFDNDGLAKAGIFVDEMGQGTIFADVKNFRIPNPQDPDSEIWYASLEGPEVGAYTRGVESLENGEKFVPYPAHFASIIDPNSVTVVLTSHEWDTYGLAVVEKRADGFVVKELKGGQGNFNFDWEVKAVRKGHENFEVVRPKLQLENNIFPYSASSIKESIGTSIEPVSAGVQK